MNEHRGQRRLLLFAVFFGGGFLLHLLWEKLHVVLYTGYQTYNLPFLVQLKASAGDLVFMAVFYLALALIHRDIYWIEQRSAFRHPATWGITALLGVLMAVGFELWAVYVDHRWIYQETMPLIPIVKVGLSPVMQMVTVPLAALWLSKSVLNAKNQRHKKSRQEF